MIEEIDINLSLFDVKRPEGTIIKHGNSYWIYTINFEGCEQCDTEEEHIGWDNVTKIVMTVKKVILADFRGLTSEQEWMQIYKKHFPPTPLPETMEDLKKESEQVNSDAKKVIKESRKLY